MHDLIDELTEVIISCPLEELKSHKLLKEKLNKYLFLGITIQVSCKDYVEKVIKELELTFEEATELWYTEELPKMYRAEISFRKLQSGELDANNTPQLIESIQHGKVSALLISSVSNLLARQTKKHYYGIHCDMEELQKVTEKYTELEWKIRLLHWKPEERTSATGRATILVWDDGKLMMKFNKGKENEQS